jgi:septal ring factor EnvC (AmiA/AmiB activator)
MTTNAIHDAVKDALAKQRHATEAALGHAAVTDAAANVQAADQDRLDDARHQRRLQVEATEHRRDIVAESLTASKTGVGTLRSQLAAEEARLQQLQDEHDALERKIADLRPAPRRKVLVDFSTADPDVPPPSLALVRGDQWRRLFAQATERRSVSGIVLISEILGAVLTVEHHQAR